MPEEGARSLEGSYIGYFDTSAGIFVVVVV